MTSPVTITKNALGQWEVRRNDEDKTLLGTFVHAAWRDLFLEALFGALGSADAQIEPLTDGLQRATRQARLAA